MIATEVCYASDSYRVVVCSGGGYSCHISAMTARHVPRGCFGEVPAQCLIDKRLEIRMVRIHAIIDYPNPRSCCVP